MRAPHLAASVPPGVWDTGARDPGARDPALGSAEQSCSPPPAERRTGSGNGTRCTELPQGLSLSKGNHGEEPPPASSGRRDAEGCRMRRAAVSQHWAVSPQPGCNPRLPLPTATPAHRPAGPAAARSVPRVPSCGAGLSCGRACASRLLRCGTVPELLQPLQFISTALPPPPQAQLVSAPPSHTLRFSGSW